MTRDAVDYLGNVVAQLSEPDGVVWSEEEWQKELAIYAKPPKSEQEQLIEQLTRTVEESRKHANEIIEEFKRQNLNEFLLNNISNEMAIMISLHVHSRLRAIDINVGGVSFTIDALNLIVSGDLETAYVVLSYMQPDNMSQPYHWFTQERIDSLQNAIALKVGF